MKTDVLIVGSGCSALYMALHLPEDLNILMVTKKEAELSDSFLAQGGICMLRNEDDYVYSGMNRIMTVILKIR